MTISRSIRDHVRKQYVYRCGYCGTEETLAGGELELEHFRPRAKGGTDDLGNLVYSCPPCNRFKAAYWPAPDAPINLHLLHPLQDNLSQHISLTDYGQLIGLTPRGWFHINWLQLNRPQLVQARLLQQQRAVDKKMQAQYLRVIETLREQNLLQAQEIARLHTLIEKLQ